MKAEKDVRLPQKIPHFFATGCFCLALSLASPESALAQVCEVAGAASAAESSIGEPGVDAVIDGMKASLEGVYLADKEVAGVALTALMQYIDTELFSQDSQSFPGFSWFWGNWYTDLQKLARTLHGGIIDQSRQILASFEASNVTQAGLRVQKTQLEGLKKYQTTDQGCQFDTTARYLGRSREGSNALATGYALDFNQIGNNERNSSAAAGQASLQQSRWQVYQKTLCDPNGNNGGNGVAGCVGGNAVTGMASLPSQTIFSHETIDMTVADTRDAVNQLLFNITGYEAPDPIPAGAVSSGVGLGQRQKNREYMAQMDAVGALAYSVVAERAPGVAAPEIQALRQKAGVQDPSPTPSAREIRQAIVEELSDPNYYQDLGDDPATIPQKELYLKAYNLLLLNDMIAKQEKISNVYAIETANMLDKFYHSSRQGALSSAPQRP
ncbi:MAG: hypothetical protein HY052_07530 [Proteobacteria bacterium]|nr:hypothetical protein [Pseudomonadota bacterium]